MFYYIILKIDWINDFEKKMLLHASYLANQIFNTNWENPPIILYYSFYVIHAFAYSI
jgi:hypothetical protein